MTKRLTAFATVVVALIAHLQMVSGQDARNQVPPQPDFSLKVWVSSESTKDESNVGKRTATLHRQVRDQMNKVRVGVPDDRIQYFEPLFQGINTPVVGWSGMVEKVTPVKDGYAVILRIQAIQDGGSDNAHLYESYTMVAGKVKYRGFIVPPPYTRFRTSK